jgi:sulfate transport system ATP-binding protein
MVSIQVHQLSKHFGDFMAVDHVSFQAEEGELVALLGPSGSGKSTILRIIAGLENPDNGKTFLFGKDVSSMSSQKRRIGFVFQHYALFKHMTVEKNIAFGLEILRMEKTEISQKVSDLIHLVNLKGYERQYPSQLSGGQRQRVALARALAPEPKIMLLDEPFGSLDAKVRESLASWIRKLHKKINVTSIFVTHDQSEAIKIADKIVAINRGRVDQVGTPKDVYEHPKSKFVASFIGDTNVIIGNYSNNKIIIEKMAGELNIDTSPSLEKGSIVLLVRPEDILLSPLKNRKCPFSGNVHEIYYQGSIYEIHVQMGKLKLKAYEEKNRFQDKQLSKGQKVHVGFIKTKMFNAPEGSEIVRRKLKQLGYLE